jgi:hypothetical protein
MNDQSYEFYFGPATLDCSDDNDADSLFQDDNGDYFYYKIVVDEDMFFIHDTCGRMVPIDREFTKNFGNAMFGVAGVYSAADEAEQLFNKRINETNKLMAFWNEQERK